MYAGDMFFLSLTFRPLGVASEGLNWARRDYLYQLGRVAATCSRNSSYAARSRTEPIGDAFAVRYQCGPCAALSSRICRLASAIAD